MLSRWIYRSINWFSFLSFEPSGCCYYQTRAYMKFGQPKGFSPDYYIYKISDFDSAAKSLRVVKARFDHQLCVNSIVEISFGTEKSEVTIIGGHPNANFILPSVPMGYYVTSFERARLKEELNFDWFKFNVVCPVQKWICNKYPVNSTNLKLS
ncbi:uncharacterized protein LOC134855113 [Symsagittifera roscoffensis]|uniref:uncharacterized protein LOC134855113 n=1 Tax=Symsagittifera roscoffensis TaxID=84072 RepID=UPI00307B95C0